MGTYQPSLPYPERGGEAPTGGHSGTDTSRERAYRERTKAAPRQARVLAMMANRRAMGATVAEVREATGWHHGTASGVLSNMDKGGRLVLLAERREGQHVYVLPEWRADRPLAARRSRRQAPEAQQAHPATLESLEALQAAPEGTLMRCTCGYWCLKTAPGQMLVGNGLQRLADVVEGHAPFTVHYWPEEVSGS